MPRGGLRMGMIVTSTGLLFATAKDGNVRAYDADTGAVLWTGRLPRGAEGLPAMYQVDGRQHIPRHLDARGIHPLVAPHEDVRVDRRQAWMPVEEVGGRA